MMSTIAAAIPTAPPTSPTRLPIPARVGGLIKGAMDALARARWDDAVELTAAASVQDIQHEGMTFLASASGAAVMGELYEQAFEGAGLTRATVPRNPAMGRPLRVLYISPGLSRGQAATDRLLNVIERHDRSRVTPMVLCTEEFTARSPALRHLSWPFTPSLAHAGAMARLRAGGVEPLIAPTLGTYLDGARAALDTARDWRPDIAVFIASSACPVQAALAWTRTAPVQINQNIGSPLVIPGVSAVVYRNSATARADAPELTRRNIETIDLPASGTDLDAADAAVAIPRRALGVPENAVLFVTAGNKIPERLLLAGFAEDLARFLAAHPTAWWMPIGACDNAAALAPFTRLGVRNRVVLAGPQADIRPHLKAADAYLNEYPEGGSNSVMEAMACGLPVLATSADDSHCRSIGAQLAGQPVPSREAYWALASGWCSDAAERRGTGARALARAREQFGFDALVRRYEDLYDSRCGTP